ncbi:hypothetical protein G6F50_016050 [Rhizopus delemar]|uniref:Uncharacterized protein n=1 Tax=Rhizopus delemar TaxID=936053 RepID=A0A9P6XV97_9FUNG|nr:hypothetical protein G6F50_016050 [Rhizopus delemar]
MGDPAPAPAAGDAGFGILGQQLQGQVQRGCSRAQSVRIAEGQQPAVFTRLLGQSDTQFRADPGGLARYQSELGAHRLRHAVPAGSGCTRLPACGGRWSRGPGHAGCRWSRRSGGWPRAARCANRHRYGTAG